MLLRYQISGSVFIAWFLLFHYSVHSADFADMATKIMDISSLATLVMAIPLGAIIHQFSVTIKNQIFGLCEESYLSDSPMKKPTRTILDGYKKASDKEYVKYLDEKISKLNSFFYMRFDNGFLAPLLAFSLFFVTSDLNFAYICNALAIYIVLIIVLIGIYYIRPVCKCIWYIVIVLLILASCIGTCCYKYTFMSNIKTQTNVELTTSVVQGYATASNNYYVTTQDYAFESTESLGTVEHLIANGLTNVDAIVGIKDSNLQKITIIESEDTALNSQTFTCTTKCTKCSLELTCTISNVQQQQDKPQHISKAEITKIDTTLLNKILIACLIISTLLLSYIPRIIQELKEYTDKLSTTVSKGKEDNCCCEKILTYLKRCFKPKEK